MAVVDKKDMTNGMKRSAEYAVAAAVLVLIGWLDLIPADATQTEVGTVTVGLMMVISVLRHIGGRLLQRYGVLGPSVVLLGVMSTHLLSTQAVGAEPAAGRVTITEREVTVWHEQFDPETNESTGEMYATTATVAELYVAPAVIVNALRVPLDRRAAFEAGVDIGGCWMLQWSPEWWDSTGDAPFLGVGPCFETGLVVGLENPEGPEGETFLAVTIVGGLTVAQYLHVGVGYRHRLSLTDEGRDTGSPILQLGLTAATF